MKAARPISATLGAIFLTGCFAYVPAELETVPAAGGVYWRYRAPASERRAQ